MGGENKFTFVEECKNPRSVTILMKGPNKHTLSQMKDAVRDGLRAVMNALEDKCVVPGAGAYEVAVNLAIKKGLEKLKGNAGYDAQDTIVTLIQEAEESGGKVPVGVDCSSGEAINPVDFGIYDNYQVKKQMIHSCTVIACNLLLVDEIMRAGLSSLKG